jgi:cytidylate kinase
VAVITISREMGCGADSVAQEVANRLGVPCADREVIEQAARQAGLPQEILDSKEREQRDQRSFSSSDMIGLVRRSQSGRRAQLEDAAYTRFIGEAIQQLASKPIVIVGRGAQFILRDRSDALHVHIHAPEAVRVARLMREKSLPREQAERMVRASDAERASYIKHYFNNANWRNPEYYDLMIDLSKLSAETAVELIVMAAQSLGG